MKGSNHFKFATFVWLTSAIVTPIFIIIFTLLLGEHSEWQELFMLMFLMMIFGAIFSIFNWIIFILGVWKINGMRLSIFEKKILIALLAINSTVTFHLVG